MPIFAPLYLLLGLLLGGYYALWQNELLASGVSIAQIAMIVALQTIVCTAADIPSGMVADRIGHKTTALLGFAIYALAFLLPNLSGTYITFAAAILLVGLAEATLNGALESWATAVQEERDGTIRSSRFMERDQWQRLGMIAGGLLIPFIVSRFAGHRGVAWLLYLTLSLALAVVALATPKPKREKPHATLWKMSELWAAMSGSGLPRIYLGVLFFGISDGVVSTCFWPTVRSFGIRDAMVLGVVQTLVSFSRLGGLRLWKKSPWVESTRLPGLSLLLSGGFFLAFSMSHSFAWAVPFWLLRVAALSAYFSAIQATILREERVGPLRATALSVSSVITSIGSALAATAVGALGVQAAQLPLACMAGAAATLVGAGILLGKEAKAGPVPEALFR